MRPGYAKPIACLLVGALMWYWAFVREESVPFLQYADLAVHEVGHVLWSPFGTTAMFLGGNGTETLVPLLCAIAFASRRDLSAAGLMLVWAGTTMQNASVYIADAPYEALQLIGGEHDWAYLFDHWNALSRADAVGAQVADAGYCLGIAGALVILGGGWLIHRERADDATGPILGGAGDPFDAHAGPDDDRGLLARLSRRRSPGIFDED